jgi:hypothetical protein
MAHSRIQEKNSISFFTDAIAANTVVVVVVVVVFKNFRWKIGWGKKVRLFIMVPFTVHTERRMTVHATVRRKSLLN